MTDFDEVVEMRQVLATLHHDPAALVLSRQALPTLDRSQLRGAEGVAKGAYVLADAPSGNSAVILLAMHAFGGSAPLKQGQTKFGFTPDRVAQVARELLARGGERT